MLNAYKFLDFVILLTEFPTIEEVCAPKNVCCCVQSLQLLRLFFFFFLAGINLPQHIVKQAQ